MPDNPGHPTPRHAAAAPISWRLVGIGLYLLCVVLWQTPTEAQQTRENGNVTVNYVYAQQFGLGGYKVGDLSVQVYPLQLPYTLHFGRDNAWGLQVTAGLSYGRFAQFISICRWVQLIHKERLTALENAPCCTPWAQKRGSVA